MVLPDSVTFAVADVDNALGDEIVVLSRLREALSVVSLEKGSRTLRPRFEEFPAGSRPTAIR